MNKDVKIQLYKEDGKGVIGYLTLTSDSDLPFTKSLADVKDVSKRKATVSKSIKVAGTKDNNVLLGNLYDVNIQALTFDRNIKQPCRVLVDGVVLIDNCVMQITSVNKIQANHQDENNITYTVNIKSNSANFFDKIKDKRLDEVGLTISDIPQNGSVVYTPQNIKDSFLNDYSDGFKIGLKSVTSGSAALTEFTPMVYVWTLFNKILKNAGYRYNFDEVGVTNSVLTTPSRDDINFRKLLIPFTGEVPSITNEERDFYESIVSETTDKTLVSNNNVNGRMYSSPLYTVSFENVIKDNSSSITSNKYKCGFAGILKLKIDTALGGLIFENNSSGGIRTFQGAKEVNIKHSVSVYKNGNLFFQANGTYISSGSNTIFSFSPNISYPVGNTTLVGGSVRSVFFNIDVLPNDEIEVKQNIYSTNPLFGVVFREDNILGANASPARDYRVRMSVEQTNIHFFAEVSDGLSYGSLIDFNRFLPAKIKQSDFVKSLFNLFNIYVDVDDEDSNLLVFKTRDYFYDSGNKYDLTHLIAKDKGQDITFLSDTQKKNKTFTYKPSSKGISKEYKELTGKEYGEATFTFDNEFITEEDKVEITFNPAVMVNEEGYYLTDMATQDDFLLLFDGGNESKPINILGWSGSSGVSSPYYPLTLHVNNPINPTFDLNFGVCESYLVSGINITTNNQFNLNWRRTMHQLNMGKMMSCYLNLNVEWFNRIKLNDLIYLRNTWYYINSIIDHNSAKTNITKLELVTIDDMQGTSSGNILNKGVIEGVSIPLGQKPIFNGGNITFNPITGGLVANTNVQGVENISVVGASVQGNNNTVVEWGSVVSGNSIYLSERDTYTDGISLKSTFQSMSSVISILQEDIARINVELEWMKSNPFKLKVTSGTSGSFTIPTTGGGYDYNLRVQGGQSWYGLIGNHTINFPSANTDYFIEISGEFPRIRFNNGGDKDKLLDIIQWGDIEWSNFNGSFYGCENLIVSATDVPNVSTVIDFTSAFRDTLITTINISLWDMRLAEITRTMFFNCINLTSNIDLSSLSRGSISLKDSESMIRNTKVKSLKLQASNITSVAAFNEYENTGLTELILIGQKVNVNTRSVSLSLQGTAIDDLFTSLGTATPGATITMTTAQNTSGIDTTIATAKGWTIKHIRN